MEKQQQCMTSKLEQLMKLSLSQLFLSLLFTTLSFASPKAQDILEKKVTIRLDNVELRNALQELEKEANVQFGYSSKAIKVQRKVSVNAQNQRLAEVLNTIFNPMRISYRVVNDQIILTNINSSETPPLSTELGNSRLESNKAAVTIGGTVRDEKGEPIPSVNITVKGITKGIQTGMDGRFQMEVNVGDVLVISSVGYTKQEITVTGKDQSNLSIVLKEDQSTLGEVTVVGSRFTKSRTDVERPVPIDVINIKELQATGQVDLGQSLHYSAPSFNAYKFGINDGAPFVDPATLRGLGPDQVLVLVNNKRRHKVSFLSINDGVGKGQVGTDINIVPSLAVKRVEVLRDGAAAQYGSDAIAGVINMQLNNASSGGTVTAYYGQGYSKPNLDVKNVITPKLTQDGKTYSMAANFGLKLAQKGFLNTTLTFNKHDGYDRSGTYSSSNGYYTKVKATDDSLVKARGINLDRAFLGSAKSETYGAFINAGLPINKNWDAYAFGGYTFKHVTTFVFTRPPSNTRRSVLSKFPDGYNPIAPADMNDFALTAGAKGKVGNGWNLDLSVNQGSNRVDWNAENTVNPSLGDASPTEFYVGQTRVMQSILNADLSKTFNEGSYPNFSIAAGTEARRENFRQKAGDKAAYEAGPLKTTKDVGSSGREGFSDKTAGNWNRTNVGIYVEGESDLNKHILLGAAARFENYSDFGSDVSYKLNTRIKIIDQLSVRGSFSRGFRAPNITQSHYSNYVNISFDNAGNSILNPIIPADGSLAAALGLGLDNGLKKETSNDISTGLTLKLGEDFLFTADYYNIKVKDRIQLSGGINVANIPAFVSAGFNQTANVFVNAFNTTTNGIELVAAYNKKIGTDSRLNINLAFSSMNTEADTSSIKKTSQGTNVVDNASLIYITDGQPRNKLIGSIGYDFKKFGITFRTTRFGEVIDPLATLTTADPKTGLKYQTLSAKTLFDVALTYRPLDKLSLQLAVNNMTDVYPDLLAVPQTTNEVVFSRRTNQFGTQGRFISLTATYNF
ncbi:MAG: TonB-dependent receptor [Saprospiraceae bacterium]|nr:TonB-dependent receptor [Saprospiraceae bacterium]